MAELQVEGDELVLHLSLGEKAASVHADPRVPLSALQRVEVLEDAHEPADHGWRVGERLPGVVEVGTIFEGGAENLRRCPPWHAPGGHARVRRRRLRRVDRGLCRPGVGRRPVQPWPAAPLTRAGGFTQWASQPNWPPSPTGHPAQLATQPNWPPSRVGLPAELASQPSWIREFLMPSFPRFSASCVA